MNEVYIGQSTNMKNRKSYYKSTRAKGQPKLCNSIKTHGWKNHVFEVIEECSLSILDIKEEHHKITYITNNSWSKALFCRLKDGRGGLDSPETKLKKSLAHIRVPKSNTHKQNLRKPKPKGFGEKISQRDFTWNIQLREGIIAAKSTPVIQYTLDGIFVKEYSTIAEPLRLGLGDVDAALRGRQKTAGGYIWKFKN